MCPKPIQSNDQIFGSTETMSVTENATFSMWSPICIWRIAISDILPSLFSVSSILKRTMGSFNLVATWFSLINLLLMKVFVAPLLIMATISFCRVLLVNSTGMWTWFDSGSNLYTFAEPSTENLLLQGCTRTAVSAAWIKNYCLASELGVDQAHPASIWVAPSMQLFLLMKSTK